MLSIRWKIIKAFETVIFLYVDGFQIEEESEEELGKESTLEAEEIDIKDMSDLESEDSPALRINCSDWI